MQAVFSGFFTIAVVIFAGWLGAHLRILDGRARAALNNTAFFLASPALLFVVMLRADLGHVMSWTLLVNALAMVAAAATYFVVSRFRWRQVPAGDRAIGMMGSCYTNAGNLGLPIAAYVLGDIAWMAPVLLLQLALLQPAFLTYLDLAAARESGRSRSWWLNLLTPVQNPITVGAILGLVANVADLQLPQFVTSPLDLLGGLAVPAMLVAFGVSLRLDPLPGKGPHAPHVWAVVAIKLVVHPLVAIGLARAFGLTPIQTLAVTVSAALPAAQNIFVIADRYGHARVLARDAIFWSTLISMPLILVLTLVIQ